MTHNPDLPCPFCGSTNLRSGGDDKIVGVWCHDCDATGPNHYGLYGWNDRAPVSPQWQPIETAPKGGSNRRKAWGGVAPVGNSRR